MSDSLDLVGVLRESYFPDLCGKPTGRSPSGYPLCGLLPGHDGEHKTPWEAAKQIAAELPIYHREPRYCPHGVPAFGGFCARCHAEALQLALLPALEERREDDEAHARGEAAARPVRLGTIPPYRWWRRPARVAVSVAIGLALYLSGFVAGWLYAQ